MDKLEKFYNIIKKEETVTLATASGSEVTMRIVSPVYYEKDILIFTNSNSKKFQQLIENPNCCISAGEFFVQATAKFCGATMLPENENLRNAYCEKFPGAFDEGMEFGGRNDDFVLFTPTRLTGWAFKDDIPDESGIPTIPFAIDLK